MNKRQITGGKNSPDKIEERRRGNTPLMINLRFGARALSLNRKVWRKAKRVNRWRTIFSLSRTWLLPALFFFGGEVVSFFYSIKEDLRGKACQLAVLNFNNSPRTHVVALKCGSAWELVISVKLNSVSKQQPMRVPCFNRWTWRKWTAPCKPAEHMAA